MKTKLLLGLALILCGGISSGIIGLNNQIVAKPPDFTAAQVDGIWKQLWKTGDPNITEPKIEKLTEKQVVDGMVGKWTVMFGVTPDKLTILINTNQLVEVSGQKDGKVWKKSGQWKVVSGKLVLFLEKEDLPDFIFTLKKRNCIFDPWAKTMMSELNREKFGVTNCLFAQTNQPGALISKAHVLEILDSIDKGANENDAAAVVANFASNAVITATVVEEQRTDTTKANKKEYQQSLEVGFKGFDNYKLQRKNVTIEIASDGQRATSLSTLIETYRFNGKAKRASTKESASFEIIGGKVLLTKIDSKVTIE